jgi:hypothetical protein
VTHQKDDQLMSNFEQQINQRVQSFVAEITELARRQALETLSSALEGAGLLDRGRGGRNGVGRRGGRSAALATTAGGRRSADQIDATCQALLGQIGSNPGQRIEQIGEAIGMRTKDLALPIRKLVGQKQIRTEGQRRATRYFPGAGGGGRRARRGRKGKAARAAAAE